MTISIFNVFTSICNVSAVLLFLLLDLHKTGSLQEMQKNTKSLCEDINKIQGDIEHISRNIFD